jgi:hypothetical protein
MARIPYDLMIRAWTRAELDAAADLDAQPLDHDFGGLLGTLLTYQRFQVTLELEMLLAPSACF